MQRQPVKSSHILSVGYDPQTRRLEVEFKDGGVYHYHDVPAEKHAALMAAESVGSHLVKHIRPHHAYSKVKND